LIAWFGIGIMKEETHRKNQQTSPKCIQFLNLISALVFFSIYNPHLNTIYTQTHMLTYKSMYLF